MIVQDTSLAEAGMAALVERIQSGDSSAEDELARLYDKRVFVMVLARTHNRETARDLTQDVLIAVLQSLRNGQIREPQRLAAFVYGTARNLVNNYFRSCTQQPSMESLSEDLPLAASADDLDTKDRINVVQSALKRVDAVDQKILLMTLVDGLKPSEIAYQLNLSSDVVRQRKCRVVKKIVDRIKKMSRKGVPQPPLMLAEL